MKLYQNPPLAIRLFIICLGLLFCLLAGVSGSILWLAIGLGIAVFGCAWGDVDYINMLRDMIVRAKNWLFQAIGFIKK